MSFTTEGAAAAQPSVSAVLARFGDVCAELQVILGMLEGAAVARSFGVMPGLTDQNQVRMLRGAMREIQTLQDQLKAQSAVRR